MSFATIGDMATRRKETFTDNVQMFATPPPAYNLDREGSLSPRWYEWRYWGRRKWIMIGVGAALILAIVIAVAVVVSRKDKRYPDYTKLNYRLSESYSGLDFFQGFNYFTGYDPTGGFVHYVPQEQAAQLNLTYASSSSAIVRVDTSVTPESVPNADTGRFSVRITSKETYGVNNLFLFDVLHSPLGCATWPALWLTDPSAWPLNGEIDIFETVNPLPDSLTTANQMTLHTAPSCSMGSVVRKQSGKTLSSSCVNSTNNNEGCGVSAGSGSFGKNWNSEGGGLLAVELRNEGIRMWQWARGDIPQGIEGGGGGTVPDPSAWGIATADFPNTECDIGARFRNQSIVVNISLCGVWAGDEDIYGESCPGLCTDLVSNNASAFKDAYWEFGGFSVYSAA